jgi:Tol biopolymer transport system component
MLRSAGRVFSQAILFGAIASLFLSGAAEATFPGDNGYIVYKKAGDLISIDPEVGDVDGQRDRTLYSAKGRTMTAPAASPKGNKVAWFEDCFCAPNIYTQKLCDTSVSSCTSNSKALLSKKLHNKYSGWDPAWSPNGKQIAFKCLVRGPLKYEICRLNADGTGFKKLTNCNCVGINGIDWSPLGDRIAFGDQDGAIRTVSPEGGSTTTIVSPTDSNGADSQYYDPNFSPDGQKLLFWSYGLYTGSILESNADGTDRHDILHDFGVYPNRQYPQWATWSPDGQKILLQSGSAAGGGGFNLYTYPRSQTVANSTQLPTNIASYTKLLPDDENGLNGEYQTDPSWGPTP